VTDVTNQIYEKIMKDVKLYVSKELMQQRLHDLKLEMLEMKRAILDVANARKSSYDHRLDCWHIVLISARKISNKIRESKYLARGDWCNTIAVILPMIELVEITSFVQYHWMVDDGEQDNEVPHAGDLLASISQKLLDRMVESENSYSNVWDEIVRNGIMWLYKDMDQTLGFKEWVHWWHFTTRIDSRSSLHKTRIVVGSTMKSFSYSGNKISCELSPSICDRSESYPDYGNVQFGTSIMMWLFPLLTVPRGPFVSYL